MEMGSWELRMELWAAQVPDGLRRVFVENQGDHETDGEGDQCEQRVLRKKAQATGRVDGKLPVETVSSTSPVCLPWPLQLEC